jgi:hypothetical protein
MINAQKKLYTYEKFGGLDEYGQPAANAETGTIKMSINLTNETINENALYSGAQYVGLTMAKNIDETYIIHYGNEKLKVLYVNPSGRYKQVFLTRV